MATEVARPCGGESTITKISEDAKAVAFQELREDDDVREQSLQQMREWINKHPAIKKCRTDDTFLLRFLRTKKFSVPQACVLMERYLTGRELYPKWFKNLDINDEHIEAIIDSGYLMPLPKRDKDNRQVFLSCAGRFDPYKHSSEDMAKTHALICEAFMDDELNQIHGYTYINDESGLLMGHVSLWSFADIKCLMACIQNSTPVRHKATHFINIPSYANKILDFIVSILSEKLKKRVWIHKNLDELTKKVDKSILPKEYGGEVPMAEIIAQFKKTLREKREMILALDDMSIDVDRSKLNLEGDMKDELGTGTVGSFRKLQVD